MVGAPFVFDWLYAPDDTCCVVVGPFPHLAGLSALIGYGFLMDVLHSSGGTSCVVLGPFPTKSFFLKFWLYLLKCFMSFRDIIHRVAGLTSVIHKKTSTL